MAGQGFIFDEARIAPRVVARIFFDGARLAPRVGARILPRICFLRGTDVAKSQAKDFF